jgi:cytochrome c5
MTQVSFYPILRIKFKIDFANCLLNDNILLQGLNQGGFIKILFLFTLFVLARNSFAFTEADWSADAVIPEGSDRANIYQLENEEFEKYIRAGRTHALVYPVNVTGVKIPYESFKNFLESDQQNPLRQLLASLTKRVLKMEKMSDFYDWLGLQVYPKEEGTGTYFVPTPKKGTYDTHMGTTFLKTDKGIAETMSCTTCHAGELFGKKIIGMSNKITNANEIFFLGHKYFTNIPTSLYALATGASSNDIKMFEELKNNFLYMDNLRPQALGLDTSLSVVGLSLALREKDPYAKKTWRSRTFPQDSELKTLHVDSKPMPWWNVKYKTRFLSDGSVVSGNPVYTNFLWNEIGRAVDLHELETWLKENQQIVHELTAAVFASTAPRYTDFFPASRIDIASAKRGQNIFENTCTRCHGSYEKAWDAPNTTGLTQSQLLETTKVNYFEKTPVKNVGTDPSRYEGMKSFADRLNNLNISKTMGTVVVPQKGYVPPPLVGIWARWPYFHNNSAPTLCDVLTVSSQRTKKYYTGNAVNPYSDYDNECVGFPLGNKTPLAWRTEENLFDTAKQGLSNAGHDINIFIRDGKEILTPTDKKDVIEFLKTL